MPMPSDPHVQETCVGLNHVLHDIFGPHPGFRPVHAKGLMLKGIFTPTPTASELSKAQHLNSSSTPVLARFSSSTGFPDLPDNDPNGNPRGLAVRFQLAETPRRIHTDIITHSTPFFPARNGDDALVFFKAVKDGTVGDYLATHPEALAFVQAPKPFPTSLAKENFFGVNAIKLISATGKETCVRYQVMPDSGAEHLDEATATSKSTSYLFDEIPQLLKNGPIIFKLNAQIADDSDITNDATVHWPPERKIVDLGTIKLNAVAEDNAEEQRKIIFDPIPRVEGVEPSDDPLLEVRAGVYLISGNERRAVGCPVFHQASL
ncbi:hypothetical protein IAR55_001205 [Kwoniella newhampshirensis]|uniref:Catalase core domain-containing protein n=1 Tax=Kwoniella newhampshirensis TaxID=1651941 RepID=A0AAW0Z538_9TREE